MDGDEPKSCQESDTVETIQIVWRIGRRYRQDFPPVAQRREAVKYFQGLPFRFEIVDAAVHLPAFVNGRC